MLQADADWLEQEIQEGIDSGISERTIEEIWEEARKQHAEQAAFAGAGE